MVLPLVVAFVWRSETLWGFLGRTGVGMAVRFGIWFGARERGQGRANGVRGARMGSGRANGVISEHSTIAARDDAAPTELTIL
jgi:hypothetical protein